MAHENLMAYSKMPASKALKIIDKELLQRGTFERIDKSDRTKAQFFRIVPGGKQFAVIVDKINENTGEPSALQTRIIFEEYPPEIEGIKRIPRDVQLEGGVYKRSFSKLAPPDQFSVLISSEKALQQILDWYTGISNKFDKESTTVTKEGGSALATRGNELNKTRNTLPGKSAVATPASSDNELHNCSIGSNAQDIFSTDTKNLTTDEREAVVNVRFGQGGFRDALIGIVGTKCWMSGLEGKQLLVASHIKPWSHCKDDTASRGASDNGLLLSSLWDSAFDAGLISFDEEWQVICSKELSQSAKQALNLDQYTELPEKFRNEGRERFLAYHRTEVFERWKNEASPKKDKL